MKRLILIAAVAAACGGGSKTQTATDHNRAGTGSSTLLVTGTITTSTSDANGPVTNFAVDLRDGAGAKVSSATVTVHNADLGDVVLVEATAGSAHYTNSKAQIGSGDFTLAVTKGSDNVAGVTLGNPGGYAINAPALNATVPANQPLEVSWTTPATAKSVTLTTRDFTIQAPDMGAYTIAAANNPARTNQRVILTRYNEVEIAGGLSGSKLSVTCTMSVDPFIVQ